MQKTRRRGTALGVAATLSVLAVMATPALGQTASAKPPTTTAESGYDLSVCPWMDTSLSADERAQLVIDSSSQEQLYRWLVEQPANLPDQTEWRDGATYPDALPCLPTVYYVDGPDGIRDNADVTTFPVQMSLASSWNEDLAYAKGAAMADEAYYNGRNVILAPGVHGSRTPLAGRTPEYLGEDPVLGGVLAAADIQGIESSGRVISDLKHFIANEQETDRQTASSNIDERTLMEFYSLPFEIAVREGEPESIMCSFNQINGTYVCEDEILTTALRDVMGFDGFVMSDFGSVHSTADSLMAGLDLELNRPIYFTPELLDLALDNGEITQDRIEEAAFRVIRSYIRGGLFDNPLPETKPTGISTQAHQDLALEIAEQGSVLLSNDGTLPLDEGLDIALIGMTASSTETETLPQVGDRPPSDKVSAADVCGLTMIARFGTFQPMACSNLVSIEDALNARDDVNSVTWVPAWDVENQAADVVVAQQAASEADVAIVVGFRRQGEFQDLADLTLEKDGDALIQAVAEVQDNTVVVLQTGSATTMPWLDEVSAVLETWYAGDVQGPATANLLFGDANPSGKLPMTFPESLDDTPTAGSVQQFPGVVDSEGIRQVDFSEGLEVGYRWYEAQEIEPLFGFGHGLSYTDFEYSNVKVTPKNSDGSKAVRISFRITNTGDVAGTDVAQVYADLPDSADLTAHRLVGWDRVTLEPGQHKNVTIELSGDELETRHLLQVWDVDSDEWVTPTGTVSFSVGGSSVDLSDAVSMTVR